MTKKTIIVTKHAEERALQRDVSLEELKETLTKPTETESRKGNIQKFKRVTDKGTNIVIAEIKGSELIVVTTWWIK